MVRLHELTMCGVIPSSPNGTRVPMKRMRDIHAAVQKQLAKSKGPLRCDDSAALFGRWWRGRLGCASRVVGTTAHVVGL